MSIDSFSRWVDRLFEKINAWLAKEAVKEGEHYKCNLCGAELEAQPVHCSYRYSGTLSGSGKVHKFTVPGCPTESCLNHRPTFWGHDIRLIGSTLYGPYIYC